ncbi:ATP-binding protein [Myceligenerans pegani]|uniref:histidine kinase n=1 Tax=Myceligenerans pegani TaxID=2776917 RepID=A0ABR9MX94_9MICO|nr:ATP-binding protein [Myceligenerans sp. TRM 65318]MBE1876013.1 ATP-binding protein [Myceligenerans sp. TRM 65318]MBE3018284.1 ATP-binding protein [Myceligenerans sp. TRM 65318]
MSSTSSTPPSRLRQVAPWVSVVGVAAFVLVAPALYTSQWGGKTLGWIVGVAAIILAVIAAIVAQRSASTDVAEGRMYVHRAHVFEKIAEERRAALDALVTQQLPAFLANDPVPPLPRIDDDQSLKRLEEAGIALTQVQEERVARRDAVQVAVVSLGRKVQASAHRIQEEASRMVQRHPTDPDILQTSMRVDHAAAQQARQAQSLAALCGEWPGQQWNEPLALPDVVQGAAGRITAFHRVEVSGDPGVAVSARIVEPLIHLVAELLANATQSSPPTTQVLVALRQVQRGAVIEIDDCGVGLDAKQLDQARDIASGKKQVSITDLGEIPQTGLAVVGTYARRHGFRVDITESVYGGLRAIVMIPGELTEPVAPSSLGNTGGGEAVRVPSVPTGPSLPTRGTASAATAIADVSAPADLPTPRTEAPAAGGRTEPATPFSGAVPAVTATPEAAPAADDEADEKEPTLSDEPWSTRSTFSSTTVTDRPRRGPEPQEGPDTTTTTSPDAPAETRPARTGADDDEFPEPIALPQRRSRREEAEAIDPAGSGESNGRQSKPARQQTAEEAGQWMGAFFSVEQTPGNATDSSDPSADAGATSEDR